DGPRSEADASRVRACEEILRERDWCGAVEITVRPANLGLARSVAQGVGSVCARWDRVIVLEDDVLVARHFLAYMNEALERYRNEGRVYQISGHSFPTRAYAGSRGSSFLPFPTTWGWATWRRAWSHYDPDMSGSEALGSDASMRRRFDLNGSYGYYRMLRRLRGASRLGNSWGIRWYWSIFKDEGLVLYPHRTLTRHFGDDGSGTNAGAPPRALDEFDPTNDVVTMPDRIDTNLSYFAAVRRHLAQENTLLRRGERLMHRMLRQSFPGASHAAP
ncbi:MAG TPA: hypothetical protein VFD83_05470, partial [Candidatus Polarisedimenticolia bacterium]|nr:hypothetical protein [Candidatus Polarisedimenticolia bacterium]